MSKELLKPLGDRVVIKVETPEEKAQSSLIYVPAAANAPQTKGQVIITGPGRILENGKSIPVAVHTGDVVIFNAHAGTKIIHNEEEYLIMHEGDIIAVI